MSRVLISEESLTNIANAIRAKNGESTTYKPGEMASAIEAIESGGGGVETCSGFIAGDDPMAMINVAYIDENMNLVDTYADGDMGLWTNFLKNSIIVTSGRAYSAFTPINNIRKIYNNSTLCVWYVSGDFTLYFS